MSNTKRSAEKEKRSWDEVTHAKKAYLKRKQEEEDAEQFKREWDEHFRRLDEEGPPF